MKKAWLSLVVCLFTSLMAQDTTGVLEGVVQDPSEALVPNALVTARNRQTGFVANQHSSSNGTFHFSYLPGANTTCGLRQRDSRHTELAQSASISAGPFDFRLRFPWRVLLGRQVWWPPALRLIWALPR